MNKHLEIVSPYPVDEVLSLVPLVGRNVVIPSDELAYIAGLFDGEGCVNFTTNKNSLVLRASITNTNIEVLDYVRGIFGGCITKLNTPKATWKQGYSLTLSNRHASRFLSAIDPWLKIKSNQATIGMAWEYLRDDRRENGAGGDEERKQCYALIARQLTWLNKKGIHSDQEPMALVLEGVAEFRSCH